MFNWECLKRHSLKFVIMEEQVMNPVDQYYDMYRDTDRDGIYEGNRKPGSESDVLKQLRADLVLQNAQYDVDERWYEAHESASAKYNELRSLGVNPFAALGSVMGNLSSDTGGASPSVSGTGQNSAVSQAIDAFSSGANAVNDAIGNDLILQRQDAEINHLNSESALNYANASEVAGLSQSTQARNYSAAAKDYSDIDVNEQQVKLIGEQYNLTVEQTRQAKQVADAFPEMNQAELNLKKSQTAEFWSQVAVNNENVNLMQHQEQELDARKLMEETQADLNTANRNLATAEAAGVRSENVHKDLVNDYERLLGFPLSADDKEIIVGYAEKGDYKGLNNFLQAAFDLSMPPIEGSMKQFGAVITGNRGRRNNQYNYRGRTTYNP